MKKLKKQFLAAVLTAVMAVCSFPDCGLPCAGSVLLWIFPVPLPEWS